MRFVCDSDTLTKFQYLLDDFNRLYEKAFPDKNEREEFQKILQRVSGIKDKSEPHTVILLTTDDDTSDVVTGGMIADWYEKSRSIHLIYLIIDPDHRNMGVGRKLIQEGVTFLKLRIKEAYGTEIGNVFFESNIPDKTKHDSFDPLTRLLVFSKMGARWIDLPYVQPALDADRYPVDNLYLLTYPQFNEHRHEIPTSAIIGFLDDLYRGLGVENPSENVSFQNMKQYLEENEDEFGDIALKSIPEIESPDYKFYSSSVTFHFLQECATENQPGEDCIYFSSFEKDLLNYRNQSEAPVQSQFLQINENGIRLESQSTYEYTSEGITHKKRSARESLAIRTSISRTKIISSNAIIWHLTISPASGNYFTEFDIIKLASRFGSVQENSTVKSTLGIAGHPDESHPLSFEKFVLKTVTGLEGVELKPMRSGIIEIDLSGQEIPWEEGPDGFFQLFHSGERRLKMSRSVKRFSKAVCGIALGIFDFERMGDEEIKDTIRPLLPNDASCLVISRGALVSVSKEDEIMEMVKDNILVSPYLLIPNTILAYNDHILAKSKIQLDRVLKPGKKTKLDAMYEVQSDVNTTVNFYFLDDIFEYPTEQAIIRRGNHQRGITSLRSYIKRRLNELSESIEVKRNNRSSLSDVYFNVFLGFIALVQFNEMIKKLFHPDKYDIWMIGIELIIIVIVLWTIRKMKIRN